MKKSTRIVKRLLALFLVVLMSINTFTAVVGDNDGAAFITKAEFDSLKNDFQSQLDRYNSSIDNKIDGAIASYLASLNVAKKALASNTRSVIAYPLNIYCASFHTLSFYDLKLLVIISGYTSLRKHVAEP